MITGKFQAQNFDKGLKGIIIPDKGTTLLDLARLDALQVVVIPKERYDEMIDPSMESSPEVKEKVKTIMAMFDDLIEALK